MAEPVEERFPELKFVDPLEVDELIRQPGTVVIDVRDEDFRAGAVPGAVNVPSVDFAARAASLAAEHKGATRTVFYCGHSQKRCAPLSPKIRALLLT